VICTIRSIFFTFVATFFSAFTIYAADPSIDFLEPKNFTGTIYSDESLKRPLFTFRRSATNSGSTIRVLREFNLPNGKPAAREHVVYENNQFKSLVLEELQNGTRGEAKVETVGGELKLNFEYSDGATKKTGSEKFSNEILTSDMVGPYISAHFDELAKGDAVKCRLMSISRAETVGFKLFKESNTTWQGKPVMIVTLQPSSIIIARLVAPLHFVVEKEGIHRVIQYSGRTTPSIRKDGKWEDLDAVTVFDWK
jgi:hypothetical protein